MYQHQKASDVLALVAYYRLDVVVAWAWLGLALFEALGFAYCAFEGRFLLEFVVADAGCVFGDEVGPCRFGDGRTGSCLDPLRDVVSADAWVVADESG